MIIVLDICLPGTSSVNGVVPCIPCPHNYFQPVSGQSQCIRCPGDTITMVTGASDVDQCVGESTFNVIFK